MVKRSFPEAALVLADGSVFSGISIGASGHVVAEVVFNTAMSGYQEILTDPSYAQQMVTMTYPHIGNVGTNSNDVESKQVWASALIIRELSLLPSSWRSQDSLETYLKNNGIVAIAGVDTRRLTRVLRQCGAQSGCLMQGDDHARALQLARDFPGIAGQDLAMGVTCKESYEWQQGKFDLDRNQAAVVADTCYHVVVYDFGVKQQILRLLVDRGCRVTVVPANTAVDAVLAMQPDGVFLSNGPGDPAACDYAITHTQQLLQRDIPLMGICLGFQILALACGATTLKMKFGHHGANHPVQDLKTSRVMITSQNHSFCVDKDSLPPELEVTHLSLFDQTVQGIRHKSRPAMAFQGHPEASPGPQDIHVLFDEFITLLKVRQNIHAKKK